MVNDVRIPKLGIEPKIEPRINLSASIADLLHEVRLIEGSLETQLARLERIERDLVFLSGRGPYGIRRPLVSDADPVAYNLDIQPRPDGSAEVAIDSGKKFSLGQQLAETFQFLALGGKDRSGNDALVGWRSRAELLNFLEQSAGRTLRACYVNHIVHLLKKALLKAGYDQNLIQTHRKKGVRLAFKRGAQR